MEVIVLILLGIGMVIGFLLLFFELHRRSVQEEATLSQKQKEIDLLRQQLTLSQNTDQNLLMKSQQAATSIDAINHQFQLLFRELTQLNKDTSSSAASISQIQKQVFAMNQIMVNKKTRGNWGEYQLGMLLELYAGDCREVYEKQHKLDNGMIADYILHVPGSGQILCIDSKFPMENYQQIIEKEGEAESLTRYVSLFKTSIKKHINDIAQKYITAQTSEQAVMFVPSEAIYAYICADCSDLLEYAFQHHVLITSPTTLIGVVFTMVYATKDVRRSEHAKELENEVIALLADAKRLIQRLEKSANSLNQSLTAMNEAQTSARKIVKRIEQISEGEMKSAVD